MTSNCPHCQGALKFNAAQKGKIEQALKKLKPGQRLPLKCPHCKKPMQLDAAGQPPGTAKADNTKAKAAPQKKKDEATPAIKPPSPPNMDWLQDDQDGLLVDGGGRDVPMSLILHADDDGRHQVTSAMEALGYQTMTVDSAQEAIEQVNSSTFACIFFHTGFEEVPLNESIFHKFMREMVMSRRRYIYYILMGPQFTSLYDIEALAHSANLVISEKDLKHFQAILHKAIPYYEQLFGPLLEQLNDYGKI